jgi:hypothetical protein
MSIHTTYRMRHYQRDPDGVRRLVWADGLGDLDVREDDPAHAAVLERQEWSLNDLSNEGQSDMLDVYFRGASASANLFLRLYDDTPIRTDSLTDLTGETSGTGYAAISLERDGTDWPTLELAAPGTRVKTGTETFTAGGTWSDATSLVLATVGSGTSGLLIAYDALSTTRTLTDSDTLDVDMAVVVT